MHPGSVRVPGVGLRVAGKTLPGVVGAEVVSNNHYQADTWRAEVALNAPGGHDLDWWGDDARVGELYAVRMGLDGDRRTMIVGEADKLDVDVAAGTVALTGRDLTSRFIDHKMQEAFQNKTASEVATILAQRRGLTPKVTATTTPVSRYYAADHDAVAHDQFSHSGTEWDFLTRLAGFEGFDVWVQGTELHFEKAVDAATVADPFGVHWDGATRRGGITRLKLDRSLTLAKGVQVEVRSWNSAKGRSFVKRSGGGGGGGGGRGREGKAQVYKVTRPNLTEDQAQKLADSLRADISKHERTVNFDVPGELDLTARSVLALSGCGGWNQRYYVNTVTRRVSFTEGFKMTVTAKNHSPESAGGNAG